MDVDWSSYNTSYFLDTAYEILSRRKGFIIINEEKPIYLHSVILLLKSILAGYGIARVIPHSLSYAFLSIQVSLHFLMRETWSFLLKAILHAVAQLGILSCGYDLDEYSTSFLNICAWFYYGSFPPAEIFLDCYIILTFLCHLGKNYYQKPHELSTMACVLFATNWLGDKFVKKETTNTLQNIIHYYIPLLFLNSFGTEIEEKVHPEYYFMSAWLAIKLAMANPGKSYAEAFLDSLKNLNVWNVEQNLSVIASRKSFLNVDASEHYELFHTILLLKSFIASYSARYIVGVFATLLMLPINFILAVCDRSAYVALSCFIRLFFICGYQYVLHFQQFSLAFSTGVWFWVCSNDHFHFFLDAYLIISALLYIQMAYKDQPDRVSTLVCILYFIDYFADKFVGQPLSTIETIATLYVPVFLILSCAAVRNKRNSIRAFIALWLLFKHGRDYFEYSVNKYILNFYETGRDFVVNKDNKFLEL